MCTRRIMIHFSANKIRVAHYLHLGILPVIVLLDCHKPVPWAIVFNEDTMTVTQL